MDKPKNIKICQTAIEEEIERVRKTYGLPKDSAFLQLSSSIILNIDIEDIEPDEIIDGSGEKQIDLIKIQDFPEESRAVINIFQSKSSPGFSSGSLINLRNGLDWIFATPRSKYKKLQNKLLVAKIEEIRQLQQSYGMGGLSINIFFTTLGDTNDISKEFDEELVKFRDQYTHEGFEKVRIIPVGAKEVIQMQNEQNRSLKKINYTLPIVLSPNIASIIEYSGKDAGKTRAIICTVKATELAKLADHSPGTFIFDLNLRPYLGLMGKVNKDIHDTCTADTDSHLFWFLNNGITLICDRCNCIKDPDDPSVKLENVQIVNGCQTTTTLREAWKSGTLKEDVYVLVKIFETKDGKLIDKITLTTNNQNKITSRDLRANDPIQIIIQDTIRSRYKYEYERKTKEFFKNKSISRKKIVANTKAGQAYLAIVLRNPSIARGYRDKIWGDYYEKIFHEATIQDLFLSFLIYSFVLNEIKNQKKIKNIKTTAIYGVFHLSRICGYLLRKDKWGKKHEDSSEAMIQKILKDPDKALKLNYKKALSALEKEWEKIKKQDSRQTPALFFKSTPSVQVIEELIKKL